MASTKRTILFTISAFMSAFMTISLFFTVVGGWYTSRYFGYNYIGDNGFSFLFFSSEVILDIFPIILMALICWGMLGCGIAFTIVLTVNFFKGKDIGKKSMTFTIISFALTALYSLIGIIAAVICEFDYGGAFTTAAYYPLLINGGGFTAYMILRKVLKDPVDNVQAANTSADQTAKPKAASSQSYQRQPESQAAPAQSYQYQPQPQYTEQPAPAAPAVPAPAASVGKPAEYVITPTYDENGEKVIFDKFAGEQKIITVYEDRLTLTQIKNLRSFMTQDLLKGTKEIYFENILSVQYKPASSLILGYIQFELPGSGIGSNFGSENSFTFSQEKEQTAKAICDYIKKRVRELRRPQAAQVVQQSSSADELVKYKQLLDMGAITREEFEAKKKQLLG